MIQRKHFINGGRKKYSRETCGVINRKGIDMINSIISYFLSIKNIQDEQDEQDGFNPDLFKNRINEDIELLEQCRADLINKYLRKSNERKH